MIDNKGSASVFLLLLFVILISAVGVLLECARHHGLKSYSEEVADMAVESVMTEYYRPLYDEYHLFFMAFENDNQVTPYIEEQSQDFLSYSIAPLKDGDSDEIEKWLCPFIMPTLQTCEVDELKWATDCEGKYFQEEAIAYMKNKSLEKIFSKFQSLLGVVESYQEETEIMEEKMECESAISESAIQTVKLMKLVDGISFRERGEKVSISCESIFVKQFVPGKVTMNNMGIRNSDMWIKVKNRCVNVNQLLMDIKVKSNSVLELETKIQLIEDQLNELDLEEDIRIQQEEEMEELSQAIDSMWKGIRTQCVKFSKLVSETEQKIEETLREIKNLQEKNEDTKKIISQYKLELNSRKGELDSELYSSLSKDVEEMQEATEGGINLEQINQQLEKNLSILKQLHGLDNITTNSQISNISVIASLSNTYLNELEDYSISSISFQYGEGKVEDSNNPIHVLKNLVSEGIMELVIPDEIKVSKQTLSQEHILYETENKEGCSGIQDIITSLGNMKDVSSLFHLFEEKSDFSELTDKLYLHFYEQEHFKDFMDNGELLKESIHYEKEYLINGKLEDKENMKETIDKIMTWRTIFHFISIMSDSEKRNIAKNTATMIVGVTGIQPLVYVTQTLILLTWSFEEALVDVAAMLQDKEVDIFKRAKDFVIEYSDLLTLSREKVQYKASQYKKIDNGISYKSFLEVLLFFSKGQEKCYRCMNIIHANMILRYDRNFSLSNCLYGFRLNINMKSDNLFSVLQHSMSSIGSGLNEWSCKLSIAKSY